MYEYALNIYIIYQDKLMNNVIKDIYLKYCHQWFIWNLLKIVLEKFSRHSNNEYIKILLHVVI